MSHITILGGTGYAGRHIAAEAVSRGHDVVVVARRAPENQLDGVSCVTGDATNQDFLADLVSKTEVVIFTLAPRGDMLGKVVQVARKLIPLAAQHGVRLGVLGGAGSLKVSEDGPRLIDTDAFPAEFKPESTEMIEVLEDLRAAEDSLQWFYISPAAGFGGYNPGERKGTYRTGGDILISDDDGKSDLSGADLGIAFVDEVEEPQHRNARFAVAY
ncbi:NAD(P)-dependent oxidoreductase [Nesterenkonia lutea]|uniref:NADH-flavin reductase n=1 Tax=Nesterenkonia lutea TaxID=272919 RepID=A0ABR9JCH1_9MICC|nr:NAD(P)H-binding protein [Nesterenkonia lutea]MBE1523621.1 putative NADH-flavin reductase [Nesterenkonia lutea]